MVRFLFPSVKLFFLRQTLQKKFTKLRLLFLSVVNNDVLLYQTLSKHSFKFLLIETNLVGWHYRIIGTPSHLSESVC
jgi:hypothetical protein